MSRDGGWALNPGLELTMGYASLYAQRSRPAALAVEGHSISGLRPWHRLELRLEFRVLERITPSIITAWQPAKPKLRPETCRSSALRAAPHIGQRGLAFGCKRLLSSRVAPRQITDSHLHELMLRSQRRTTSVKRPALICRWLTRGLVIMLTSDSHRRTDC